MSGLTFGALLLLVVVGVLALLARIAPFVILAAIQLILIVVKGIGLVLGLAAFGVWFLVNPKAARESWSAGERRAYVKAVEHDPSAK